MAFSKRQKIGFSVLFLVSLVLIGIGFWLYKNTQVYPAALKTVLPTVKPTKHSPAGQVLEVKEVQTYNPAQIDRLAVPFYGAHQKLTSQYSVKRYEIFYTSFDQNDQPITILGQIFVPVIDKPTELPVYVFGQGTTGIADQCAPSRERPEVNNWGNYIAHMLSYASAGYITVFPDYEGFNDESRVHHYFNAELEGRVLLDAARATKNFFEKEQLAAQPLLAYFFAGYSEGGHAAFAVKDIAADYAPEVPIKGVIGYGPTTNIANLLKENPALAPYLIYTYSDFYGQQQFNPAHYLAARWIPNLATDVNRCVSDVTAFYGNDGRRIFEATFYDALMNNRLETDFPEAKKFFDENSSGLKGNDIPAAVMQGSIDPIVTNKSQAEFISQSCDVGNKISYFEFPGVHHYQVRQASSQTSIKWMKDILDGKSVQNNCNKF